MTQTEYEQLHRWSLEQELQDPALGPGFAAMRKKLQSLLGHTLPRASDLSAVPRGFFGNLTDDQFRYRAWSPSVDPQRLT